MEGKFQAVLGPIGQQQPGATPSASATTSSSTAKVDCSRQPAQPTSSKSTVPPTIIEEPPITPIVPLKNNQVKATPQNTLNSLNTRRGSSKSPSPSSSRRSSKSSTKSTKSTKSNSKAPQQAQHANGTTKTVNEKHHANGSASSVKSQATSFFSRLTHSSSKSAKSKPGQNPPPVAPLPINSLPKDLSWKPLDPKSPTDEGGYFFRQDQQILKNRYLQGPSLKVPVM